MNEKIYEINWSPKALICLMQSVKAMNDGDLDNKAEEAEELYSHILSVVNGMFAGQSIPILAWLAEELYAQVEQAAEELVHQACVMDMLHDFDFAEQE